jgi:hypothetical protein
MIHPEAGHPPCQASVQYFSSSYEQLWLDNIKEKKHQDQYCQFAGPAVTIIMMRMPNPGWLLHRQHWSVAKIPPWMHLCSADL